MNVASRDSKMKNIASLTSHHTQAIAEGFAIMKKQAHNNPRLLEVLEEHRKGVRETIEGLEAQRVALGELVEYLDEKRDAESARGGEAHVEAKRIMDEVKRIDREIARLTRDFE